MALGNTFIIISLIILIPVISLYIIEKPFLILIILKMI